MCITCQCFVPFSSSSGYIILRSYMRVLSHVVSLAKPSFRASQPANQQSSQSVSQSAISFALQ